MSIIDADAHVVESEHTWDYMEPADRKYRPLVVKPTGEGGGEYWFIDGKIRGLVRIVMTAQELGEVADRTGRVMFTPQETREMENVEARLKHMDELGIDVQVLYPYDLHRAGHRQGLGGDPPLQELQPLADRPSQPGERTPALDLRAAAARHEHGPGGAGVLQAERRLRRLHAPHRGPSPADRPLLLPAVREGERARHGRGRARRQRQPPGAGPSLPVQRRRQLLEVPHPGHRHVPLGDHGRDPQDVPQAPLPLGRGRGPLGPLRRQGPASAAGARRTRTCRTTS